MIPKTRCFIGCAANEAFAERLAWDLLRNCGDIILNLGEEKVAQAKPLSLNSSVSDQFRKAMSGSKDDKLAVAQNKVDDTKLKMQDNMSKMVQNYDNLQDLEGKMDDVEYESKQYKKDATSMKWNAMRQYWWAILLVVLVIFIILISIIIQFAT